MNSEDLTSGTTPSTTEKVDDSVRLSQGVHVPRAFHDELFRRVAAHVPRLQFGREYAVHELVEAGYWASIWSRQWQAARCVPAQHRLVASLTSHHSIALWHY